jgi:ATP-dependent Clp protease ATP-binding subunit ClpA
MGIKFLRYDMSEYMEKHAVSRLIGAPPGYVGFDQGGLLTEDVNKHPYSVILFDEIEKAHPDLMNILLQVLDYGFLTDNNGRRSDFRNTVIILTTNAGAHDGLVSAPMGFVAGQPTTGSMKAIQRYFSPEFLNRLDGVVQFKGLDRPIILNVVDKFLFELEKLLGDKGISITVSDEVRNWLAKNGYDVKYGARPIHRLIQERLKRPLVDEVLFGKLEKGGHVEVTIDEEGKPRFVFEEKRHDKPEGETGKGAREKEESKG